MLRNFPLTAECIIACASLFMICSIRGMEGESFEAARRDWGAPIEQQIRLPGMASDESAATLTGPIDLWNGQWWRIPLGVIHHQSIIHLIVNCVLLWVVGQRLERRWGSLRYLLFLVPAIFVPLVAEAAIGHVATGLSGVVCVVFGAIIALQQIEPAEDDFSDEAIQIVLGMILTGIPITMTGLASFANVAHVTGVVYGWFTAWVLCGPFPRTAFIRLCFVVAHLILVPVFWLATHPIENARYLWFRAADSKNQEKMLRMAIETDPALSGIWVQLAELRVAESNYPGAWTEVINGLSSNPADARLIQEARRLWMRLKPGNERELAEEELRQKFGKRADAWVKAIRHSNVVATTPRKTPEPKIDLQKFRIDRPIELPWQPGQLNEEPRDGNQIPLENAIEGTAI